jgi:PAS domain S-box-containing protein
MHDIALEKIAQVALENSGLGFFHVLLTTGEMRYSPIYSIIITGERKVAYSRADFLSYLHPGDKPVRDKAYAHAEKTGKLEYQARTTWEDGSIHWVHVRGTFLTNEDGKRVIITGTIDDVTDQVIDRRKIEDSELFSRSVFYSSPVAKIVFTGPDMIIKTVNENMLAMLGRDEAIIGRPFMEAMPELALTDLLHRLRHVYASGETYNQPEEKFILNKTGVNYTGYYNYIYKPLYNTSNNIYGIMVTATEITEQVLARQKVEIAEFNLRSAIELAELATWSIDLKTNQIQYSERMREWFGILPGEVLDMRLACEPVIESDRKKIDDFISQTILERGRTATKVEFTVKPLNGGLERIIHSQGKCFIDEYGEPYKISGASQDVTAQKKLRMALEHQVQARTEELQSVNQELTATNEELFETNSHLLHSNEELAQYAYVASHDLQEPLRKIRMFTDILSKKENLQNDHKEIVFKVNKSAERMSLLIESLLEFSRLIKSDILSGPVDLNLVVSQVKSDFELIIQEKKALINIGKLQVIDAIGLQMNQLFYNLLGNALKFTRAGIAPVISIEGEIWDNSTASKHVMATLKAPVYYHITVKDNGIGIEPQYADQIFDVFKRLHPRDIYPGSGIGLALCRRIVSSHDGHIYMESETNRGTTCHVLLPLRSDKNKQKHL